MSTNNTWPFINGSQVHGMELSKYLAWAAGNEQHEKKLLLPPIQRGFVWKPKQIVDLWDSLFRGMPIGSLMVSKLSDGQEANDLSTKKTESVTDSAMGLLDGQQRTLAMLIGWPFSTQDQHCLWIDLGEKGHAGSPFELRLTTPAQPFGFQRITQGRLSRHERKEARKSYDNLQPSSASTPDYELFTINSNTNQQPRPWKAGNKPDLFIKLKEAWKIFKDTQHNESEFLNALKHLKNTPEDALLSNLHKAFMRIESLEVPLILIPEHISTPQIEAMPDDEANPLILLFERIGRNGASLTAEDLLFSMIKQQWPKAQDLVNQRHGKISVTAFMGATDYVMTAFRLAAAETKIADNPRPNANDFHRHLGTLLGQEGETDRPLRNYLEQSSLTSAFEKLYHALLYKGGEDIGLPLLMMPHLSRGLVQVILRWILLNKNSAISEANREKIISFSLFWYLHVWNEDKSSKKAFEIINNKGKETFPAEEIYQALTDSEEDKMGLALPLMPFNEIQEVLNQETSASLRGQDAIFKFDDSRKIHLATFKQRELYKRFCWSRKPILLWLQRIYVDKKFGTESIAQFAGLTDEECVPYDYDHLCPQNHWGAYWPNITKSPNDGGKVMTNFQNNRHTVGNCIGNLHVLESSLNRSFGDKSLESKLKSGLEDECYRWLHTDSLLYHKPEHQSLWQSASPDVEADHLNFTWDEARLQDFQNAIYSRAKGLYYQYYEACKKIAPIGSGKIIG
jgi:hypothetical protein